MIKRLSLALAASLIALSANAAPVELREQMNSRERELVNVMFSSYLADRVGTSIQTSVVDIDGDGVGEIIARFVHTNSCDAGLSRCRTTISRFNKGKWNVVFDRYAGKINDLQVGHNMPGEIIVDEMKWEWDTTSNSYAPTRNDKWTPVSWQEVPQSQAAGYASFFGQGAGKLVANNKQVHIEYSTTQLSKKKDVLVIRLSGKSVCGTKNGCPIRLIQHSNGKWNTILSSSTKKDVFRTVDERDGFNDIILESSNGFAGFGWNGATYSIANRYESNRKEQ